MKQWMKKIVLGACLAISLLVFAGCAKETVAVTIDPMQKQTLESSSLSYMESLGSLPAEEIQKSIDQAEHDRNAIVYNGLTNYLNSMHRLGAFVSADSAEAVQEADGSYRVEITSTFEKRKLHLTLGLSEDRQAFTEMTFEPEYSFGEKFGDAAGNLVVGMGTVIVVLIFIAWIISLLKYVNVFEKRRKAGGQAAAAPAAVPAQKAAAAPVNVSGAELEAVIAAAIAAYEADRDGESDGFVPGPTLQNGLVVRSIRRR